MKKNLRIVSAAAAALLAVAPVAASAVNVNAATVPVEVNGKGTAAVKNTKVALSLSVSDVNSIKDGAAASSLKVNLDSTEGTPKVNGDGKADVYAAADVTVKDGLATVQSGAKPVDTLKAGQEYTVVVKDVTLSGFSANQKAVTVNGVAQDVDTYGNITSPLTVGAQFTVPDPSKTGNPYFVTKKEVNKIPANTAVSNGMVSVSASSANKVNVADVVSQIEDNYDAKIDGTAAVSIKDVKKAVEDSLKAANVNVDNGSFTAPSSNVFTVTLTANATNGKTATFPVLVSIDTSANSKANLDVSPLITFAGTSYKGTASTNIVPAKDVENASFNYIKLNDNVDVNAIKAAFSAKTDSSTNASNLQVSVDTSKVNTAVAGSYPVVVSATNANGKTTKVTFNLHVGEKGATYKTVKSDSPIYTINGNNVTEESNSVKDGQSIATFGEITVNGVSYTRLNSKDSDQFVKTSAFTAETTKSAKVMYKSAVYDKDGKSTGKTIGGYTDKDFVTTSNGDLKVVEIKGGNFYQLAKGEGYVRVRNVTGSKMTLKHNAYVYKSNGKRANKKVYKKGSTVTVYGGQYKAIKKYKGKAVRIGVNRYVKVANVNYKLAK